MSTSESGLSQSEIRSAPEVDHTPRLPKADLLPDTLPHYVEESIAMQVASGVPTSVIVSNNKLRSKKHLEKVLGQSHMPELVKAQKERLETGASTLLAKMMLHSDEVLDNVIKMATDHEHPQCTKNAHYVLDSVLPRQSNAMELNVKFDETVAKDFIEGLTQLREAGHLKAIPVIDLINDPHLRDGEEVMLERDALGSGTASSDRGTGGAGDAGGDGEFDGRDPVGSLGLPDFAGKGTP